MFLLKTYRTVLIDKYDDTLAWLPREHARWILNYPSHRANWCLWGITVWLYGYFDRCRMLQSRKNYATTWGNRL